MKDFVGGLTEGGWTLFVGWILPGAIGVSSFAFLVLPSISYLPILEQLVGLSFTERITIIGLASLLIGLCLSALQTQLYRLAEGYIWPSRIRASGRRRQLKRYQELIKKADAADDDSLETALLEEKIGRFPPNSSQGDIAPTALGNSIRSLETYAWNRWKLDSQSLWGEVLASAPEYLRDEQSRARAAVDFFVASAAVCLLYFLAALLAMFAKGAAHLIVGSSAVISIALVFPLYRGAITATDHWRLTTRALVNMSRLSLLRSLGCAYQTI